MKFLLLILSAVVSSMVLCYMQVTSEAMFEGNARGALAESQAEARPMARQQEARRAEQQALAEIKRVQDERKSTAPVLDTAPPAARPEPGPARSTRGWIQKSTAAEIQASFKQHPISEEELKQHTASLQAEKARLRKEIRAEIMRVQAQRKPSTAPVLDEAPPAARPVPGPAGSGRDSQNAFAVEPPHATQPIKSWIMRPPQFTDASSEQLFDEHYIRHRDFLRNKNKGRPLNDGDIATFSAAAGNVALEAYTSARQNQGSDHLITDAEVRRRGERAAKHAANTFRSIQNGDNGAKVTVTGRAGFNTYAPDGNDNGLYDKEVKSPSKNQLQELSQSGRLPGYDKEKNPTFIRAAYQEAAQAKAAEAAEAMRLAQKRAPGRNQRSPSGPARTPMTVSVATSAADRGLPPRLRDAGTADVENGSRGAGAGTGGVYVFKDYPGAPDASSTTAGGEGAPMSSIPADEIDNLFGKPKISAAGSKGPALRQIYGEASGPGQTSPSFMQRLWKRHEVNTANDMEGHISNEDL